jgi:hypothetical protein
MSLPVHPGNAVSQPSSLVVCTNSQPFFTLPRTHTTCTSRQPPRSLVAKHGDYARSWWMKQFWDGTIDLSLQTDSHGCVVLNRKDAENALTFKNPLRDPPVVVRRDGRFHLRDGFHRISEALARGFRGRVWAVVLDIDEDDPYADSPFSVSQKSPRRDSLTPTRIRTSQKTSSFSLASRT